MPVISIPTSFNIDVEFELPSFGRRMAAWLIDMLLQFFYLMLAGKIVNAINLNNSWDADDSAFNMWAIQLIVMVPISVYYILMEVSTNGQSLGKKIMKIRVVNINGGKASISQLIIRWLLRVSDLWMFILLYLLIMMVAGSGNWEVIIIFILGFCFLMADIILVMTSRKSQRIGDILANTILIKTSSNESIDNTVFREVEDNYVPMFPQVMRISDKDLNVVKTILDQCNKTGNYFPARAAADKIKNYLQIQSDLEPETFLNRLMKDYNYLSAK